MMDLFFLQQTGTQVTMMVPPTSPVSPSKEGGREKLKYSTIEKSEEMIIKNSLNNYWPT